MIKELLYLVLLALAFPSGIYLAKVCREEIVKWRKRMITLAGACFFIGIGLLLSNFRYRFAYFIGLVFVMLTFLIIVWKSYR